MNKTRCQTQSLFIFASSVICGYSRCERCCTADACAESRLLILVFLLFLWFLFCFFFFFFSSRLWHGCRRIPSWRLCACFAHFVPINSGWQRAGHNVVMCRVRNDQRLLRWKERLFLPKGRATAINLKWMNARIEQMIVAFGRSICRREIGRRKINKCS